MPAAAPWIRRTSSPPRRSPPSRLLPIVFTRAGSTREEGGTESADAPPATVPDPRCHSQICAHRAQSGSLIRRRIASHPQSPVDAAHATIAPSTHLSATGSTALPPRHSSSSPNHHRRSSWTPVLLIPELPPLLLIAKPSPEPPCHHSSSPNRRRRSSSAQGTTSRR
uniref:Uncharacterized protein n=1 Tax=Oryza sativa subsp. japonica TaxID=39947 RepID=Q6YXJ5_ORYSJ|nr:hypothetical protein [Oryza sativa Japonica Group]